MKRLDPELVAAMTIAILKHRATLYAQSPPQHSIHYAQPQRESPTDRWVATGRARQNQPWHPKKS